MANNVLVNNLCSWPLYFNRAEGHGSYMIPANAQGFPLLSMDEIKTQIQMNNPLFIGTDGMGSHARIQIPDDAQRREAFGLSEDSKEEPVLLNDESIKELLSIKTKTKFKERLSKLVHTEAEKRMLVDIAFANGAEDAESWKVDALRELSKEAKI